MINQLTTLYPLSYAQQRILLIERLFEKTPIHNLAGYSIYETEINFNTLLKAVNLFVREHDAARIRYSKNDLDKIEQTLVNYEPFQVELIDFSDEINPIESFESWIKEESMKVFEWENSNLLRFKFFRIETNKTGYFTCVHHSIADGWSVNLMIKFISQVYEKLEANLEIEFSKKKKYFNYVLEEQEYLSSANFDNDKVFWKNKIKELPVDYQIDFHADTKGEQIVFNLESELGDKIREIASRNQLTLPSLITALVTLQIFSERSQRIVGVGLPIFNHKGSYKEVFGMMTTILPLFVQLSEELSIKEFFKLMVRDLKKSFPHIKFPYELILKEYQKLNPLSNGLFDFCVNYYNTKMEEAACLSQHKGIVEEQYTEHQIFPIYLVVKEWTDNGNIEFAFNFKPRIYNHEDISKIYDDIISIVDRIYKNPTISIKEVFHKGNQSQNKMLITNLDSRKEETIIYDSFPKKTDERVGTIKNDFIEIKYEVSEFDSFNQIEELYRSTVQSVFVMVLMDILRRYTGNQKLGLSFYCNSNKTINISHSFEKGDTIKTTLDEIAIVLEKETSVFLHKKAEVLCYIRDIPEEEKSILKKERQIILGLELVGTKLNLNCLFNRSLFDSRMIDVVLKQFIVLLDDYKTNRSRKIEDCYFISEEEKHEVLNVFNNTSSDLPAYLSIIEPFEELVNKYPNLIALRYCQKEMSYKELNTKAEKLAALLISKGIRNNDVIPIMAERSLELIVGIFAILKTGAAYLPIDANLPAQRIKFILEDCNARFLLSNISNLSIITSIVEYVNLNDKGIYNHNIRYETPSRLNTDLAYVIYTSGSTGNPKGVLVSHLAALNRMVWMQKAYPISIGDVILQKTSISFDVSVWELFWWSMTGAACCLLETKGELDPVNVLKTIKDENISVIHFVPPMLKAFLGYVSEIEDPKLLNNLKFVFSSGEALQVESVNSFYTIFDTAKLINLYGPTEATIDVSYHNLSNKTKCEKVPIGKPIDNIELYVMNSKLKLLPIGIPGELCIAGIGLALGYLNREQLTEEKFVDHPFKPDQKLYRTGDLVRWLPDGELEFIGRIDNQIKLRGYRIELKEIEITIRKHKAVKDTVVIINKGVNEVEQIVAFVQCHDIEVNEKEIILHLTKWLPDYMVPSNVHFLKNIPLLSNGKIDRKSLKQIKIVKDYKEYVAPETKEEIILSKIWSEVLNIEKIGVDDNFFSIGGDSIKFVTILSKARKEDILFTYQDLFEYPTIKGLLDKSTFERSLNEEVSSTPFELLTEVDKSKLPNYIEDAYPLSVLQAGLLYQSEIQKGTALYYDVFSYRVSGTFDNNLFTTAIEELVKRNQIIRTTYHLKEYSEYIQLVHISIPLPLNIIDISDLDKEQQDSNIEEYVRFMQNQTIDFEQPGIISFHIHILSDSEYMYTVGFHDSALDGWSVNLLHTSLFDIYYSLLKGNLLQQNHFSSKFSDFIKLERKSLNSESQQLFWKAQLKDYIFTKLPRWIEEENKKQIEVAYYNVSLPDKLSDNVKSLASELKVPIKTVLLAAHCRVLVALSGNSDIVTGYEISGRPEKEDAEKILGLFLNTIPFRISCENISWSDFIKQVHQAELNILPYRRYPMAHIKRELGGRSQLFETVFNYTHFHVLKRLEELDGFNLVDVRMEAETEFVLRAEFSLHPFTDDLLFWLHYHANEFTEEEIERISGYYIRTLELMTKNKKDILGTQSILSKEERKLLINEFNNNKGSYPLNSTVIDVIQRQVDLSPNSYAVRFEKERWSYLELNSYANKIANFLIDNGFSVGSPIAVSMLRTNHWMATVLGIMKAGGVYVPMDTEWPENRTLKIINKIQSNWAITDNENNIKLEKIINSSDFDITILNAVDCINSNTLSTENPQLKIQPDDLAYIIFTSGSTGEPKGAMIEHEGMLNHLYSKINDLELKETDVIAQNSSQCFDISVWQLIAGLIVGSETVIYSNNLILDINEFSSRIIDDKITILEFVPSYLEMVLHLVRQKQISFIDIRYLLVTGEPLKIGLVNAWFDIFEIPIVNAYGPTEASDDITHHFILEKLAGTLIPVGKTIQNLTIHVIDNFGQLAPLGSKGDVYVSGIGVGRGYIGDSEKTKTVFTWDYIQNDSEIRMYKTGDLGRWTNDGVLQLFGRKDDQIKLNGHRIDLGEIESQLQKHSDVRNASVIFNLEKKELIAFLVCTTQDKEGLKRYLTGVLPKYMIPNSFEILEELPQTANGKIDRKALTRLSKNVAKSIEVIHPLKEEEEIELAKAWSEVLNIKLELIHANSNFYDLGGHSLKAMQLSIRLERQLGINDILKYPVLRDMVKKNQNKQELLVDFVSPKLQEKAKFSIIGCTYAGGNASNFLEMFNEINTADFGLNCYAIEYPREEAYDIRKLARLCAEGIKKKINTPIVIWGHCSGSALAIELVKVLEESDMEVTYLFIGGKVLNNKLKIKGRSILSNMIAPFAAVDATKMTNEQIKKWLVNKSGLTEIIELGEEETNLICNSFRIDSVAANNYLIETALNEKQKINTPIINVIAVDDPLTKGYLFKYKYWGLISNKEVELTELNDGGHYFIKSQAKELTKILRSKLFSFNNKIKN